MKFRSPFTLFATGMAMLGLASPLAAQEMVERPETVKPGVRLLSLKEATRLAIQQNSDVLRAIQEIEQAYGIFLEVRASSLPLANVTSNFSEVQPTLANQMAPENWNVTVQVSQPLYTGGRNQANIRIAKLSRSSSYYALEETILSVISEVRKTFSEVLVNRALIKVREETIVLLNRQLQDTKNRFEAGTVPRFDVLRAEVEVANAMPALISAQNSYRLARFNLANLLGINPGALQSPEPPVDAVGDLATNPPPFGLAEGLAYAKSHRAVLRVQEQNVEIGREQIKSARSGYLPNFSISGGYEAQNQPGAALDRVNSGYFFGVTGSWNIFDGFETKGLVEQAKAQLATARINLDEAIRDVELQVQDSYSRLEEAKALIASQEKNVEQAAEALELGEARFAAGASTQLDVLDARVALTTAQVTELEARFLYTLALTDVIRFTAYNTHYEARLDDPLLDRSRQRIRRPTIVREPADPPIFPSPK